MPRAASQSLTQTAYENLRADLLACRFEPGKHLRIADLCARLSVSQGIVREALSRLTSEGLIEALPQRGFKVVQLSATDLLHLTSALCEIESVCLKRSIAIGNIQWESGIVAAYHTLAATPQLDPAAGLQFETFLQANDAFRNSLVAACDNPWLAKMRHMLRTQALRYQLVSKPERNAIVEVYGVVMQHTLARNAEKACEILCNSMMERAQTAARLLAATNDTDADFR